MTTVDVDSLVAEAAAPEGQGCHTCAWLSGRDPEEAAKWRGFLDQSGVGNAQLARAMRLADENSPGEASISNHRRGHDKNRTNTRVTGR